MNEAYQC